MAITKVNAEYTGGNIWIFFGELDDGSYFLTDDDGRTQIFNADPSDLDESLDWEWQKKHLMRDLDNEDERVAFCNELCDKLLTDGNDGGFTEQDILSYRLWFAEPIG